MTEVAGSALQVDRQRRTTIPRNVLDAAGIPAGSSLVARAEAPGRIVLESPQLLLSELQRIIAEGAAEQARQQGRDPEESSASSMAEELLAERAAEAAAEVDEADAEGEREAGGPA